MIEASGRGQPARRGLTITADDFGLCPEVNAAICRLHDRGIIQRTSWLVNTEHFDASAAALRDRPTLEVAIHLNLTDGRPVLPASKVASLVTARGVFPGGRHYGVAVRGVMHRLRPAEVRAEWSAQIARAKAVGIAIERLNGHGHVHLLPSLAEVVADLTDGFGITHLRLVRRTASLRGIVFGSWSRRLLGTIERRQLRVASDDRVLGLDDAGGLTKQRLRQLLTPIHPGATELIVHPAAGGNEFHSRWGYEGVTELEALLSAETAAILGQYNTGRLP